MGSSCLYLGLLLQYSIFETRRLNRSAFGLCYVHHGPHSNSRRYLPNSQGPKSNLCWGTSAVPAHAFSRPNFGKHASAIQPTNNWNGVGRKLCRRHSIQCNLLSGKGRCCALNQHDDGFDTGWGSSHTSTLYFLSFGNRRR